MGPYAEEEYVVDGYCGYDAPSGILKEMPQLVEPACAAVQKTAATMHAPAARKERDRMFIALV